MSEIDVFAKYRQYSDAVVTLKADTTILERQKEFSHRLQELRTNIRTLADQRGHLQTQIEANVEKQNSDDASWFSRIQLFFSEIVENVIDLKALLSASLNKEGHLEFKAKILDDSCNATSADLGHTYRKLLCIPLDLAVLRAHLEVPFPRFVFHDGVSESLDDRKRKTFTLLSVNMLISAFSQSLPRLTAIYPCEPLTMRFSKTRKLCYCFMMKGRKAGYCI